MKKIFYLTVALLIIAMSSCTFPGMISVRQKEHTYQRILIRKALKASPSHPDLNSFSHKTLYNQ